MTHLPVLSLTTYDEAHCLDALLQQLDWDDARSARIQKDAADLVTSVRGLKRPAGQLEAFLQKFSLTSAEGLAMMGLAEALLRIPDATTANALIEDKISAVQWLSEGSKNDDWMVKAAGLGLSISRATLSSVLGRLGQPVIREAMAHAMRIMSQKFVLGTTINDAIKNAQSFEAKKYHMSYDMLGEGARTQDDADTYFQSYQTALSALNEGAGISVKLSALYPRYEYAQRSHAVPFLQDRLMKLAQMAAEKNCPLTVDAEEVRRLSLSLQILAPVIDAPELRNWNGLGLAVQAYQKRAPLVIDWVVSQAREARRIVQIRLVKGAYWDSEIKRAQVLGLADYPVFTRKINTDVSYLTCAAKMLQAADCIFPLFATHNAHTAASVIDLARQTNASFGLQRLHGMGEALYDVLRDRYPALHTSIYAPVGPQADLLAYLVRRLLENGANTSFVHKLLDPNTPISTLVRDPVHAARQARNKRHAGLVLPAEIYHDETPSARRNSRGIDLTDPQESQEMMAGLRLAALKLPAAPSRSTAQSIPAIMQAAKKGFQEWSVLPVEQRAHCLETAANLIEQDTHTLIALLNEEGGKTIQDALAEIREALDFCRYYAARGRLDLAPHELPAPTGERNMLFLEGRGIFACISPWNFPLAIFIGQIAAALMAGNSVIAKPAGQTPRIAAFAVELLHRAGVPKTVLHLFHASASIMQDVLKEPDIAGVALTGSTETAWAINRLLAAKNGPIVPLIAETGGINAMIVDSSSLAEQVVDDVITSAFTSAGQRCSALRLLCVQEDCAEKILHMLRGAMAEIRVGPANDLASDVGPVIDAAARDMLQDYERELQQKANLIARVPLDAARVNSGAPFFAPCAYEIQNLELLTREVFGPILHVYTYAARDQDKLVSQLNAKGYGLTCGIHSRLTSVQNKLSRNIRAGNIYINRSMIGAVVGAQPFGGMGLSGTGPKAGGPHYLARFSQERVISTDTTAAGGNTSLVSLPDEEN